jgi:geranylgeranyl pyrophosphate synthase
MTTVNFLASVQEPLQQVEALMRIQADQHHPDLAAALQHLLSSGGKRVRPAMALMVGKMLGGDPQRLVTLGAAIELLHTATLVHDDLIDGAFLRRGIATLNAQWSPAATVLTGDFIFARAARLASATNSVTLMHMFAETLATIVNGEITQLFSSHGLASRENYDQRIYAKTASLFELSAGAPVLLSPVSPDLAVTMRRFGYLIGMAFQIVDDILDFTADQAALGKPVAGDQRQGLITLPALYYLESAPGDPGMQLIREGKTPTETEMLRLVQSIRSSGAIERAQEEAHAYAHQAIDLLTPFPPGAERQGLEEMARYFVNRKL